LIALIATLAERRVLSFEASKAVIAEVLDLSSDKNATSGQGTVLRQILSGIEAFAGQAVKMR
jgi:hypothetical protein